MIAWYSCFLARADRAVLQGFFLKIYFERFLCFDRIQGAGFVIWRLLLHFVLEFFSLFLQPHFGASFMGIPEFAFMKGQILAIVPIHLLNFLNIFCILHKILYTNLMTKTIFWNRQSNKLWLLFFIINFLFFWQLGQIFLHFLFGMGKRKRINKQSKSGNR